MPSVRQAATLECAGNGRGRYALANTSGVQWQLGAVSNATWTGVPLSALLERAGVQVIEARISHLAYAAEIAAAMLRRQQAGAVVAARTKIVEGAVGMVEMALASLAKSAMVQLDEERKAAMVSNLLVVLCGERDAQPVVNTGTLYQ